MWESAFAYWKKEWHVLKQAPILFLMTLMVGALAVFFVVRWHYTEQIDTLRDKSSFYEDRLQATINGISKPIDASAYKWLQPICTDEDDYFTESTALKILLFNEKLATMRGKDYSCKNEQWK